MNGNSSLEDAGGIGPGGRRRAGHLLTLLLVFVIGIMSWGCAAVLASSISLRIFQTRPAGSQGPITHATYRYLAAPGEINRVSVTTSQGALVISDTGAVITSDPNCSQINPHRVLCPWPRTALGRRSPTGVEGIFFLGSGDDTLGSSSFGVSALGGGGADRLSGRGVFDGGVGNDTLAGSIAGYTTLRGGDGNDVLTARGVSTGTRGNREYLSGGNGNDVLRAARGDDVLYGGAGSDRVYGGGGVDFLSGGVGDDRLYGGEGNDVMFGGLGLDVIFGGPGPRDRIDGRSGNFARQ